MCCCPHKIERYWEIVKKLQNNLPVTSEEKDFLTYMRTGKKNRGSKSK